LNYRNRPSLPSSILDRDGDRARRRPGQPFGPLDGQHTTRGELAVQTDVVEIGAIESVQIDMHQRQAATTIFMDESERWARHLIGIDA
jgi:hypothetical protein